MTLETWQLASAAAILGFAVGMIGLLVWSLRADNAPGDDCSDFSED